MKTLIFEKPSLAPLPNRIGWAFFTAFFWIVWVYLWMPLITLGIWALGFGVSSEYFIANSTGEIGEMKHLFILYSSVVAVMGGALLAWARTEFLRFRDINRRTRPESVAVAELAEYAEVESQVMATLSTERRIVVHHDEHGKFLYADVLGQADALVSPVQLKIKTG